MKKKPFDCVEMKRRGAEKVRQQTQNMTPEQELEFWQKRTEALRSRQEKIKSSAQTTTSR
jgi:hypothetical protein